MDCAATGGGVVVVEGGTVVVVVGDREVVVVAGAVVEVVVLVGAVVVAAVVGGNVVVGADVVPSAAGADGAAPLVLSAARLSVATLASTRALNRRTACVRGTAGSTRLSGRRHQGSRGRARTWAGRRLAGVPGCRGSPLTTAGSMTTPLRRDADGRLSRLPRAARRGGLAVDAGERASP